MLKSSLKCDLSLVKKFYLNILNTHAQTNKRNRNFLPMSEKKRGVFCLNALNS